MFDEKINIFDMSTRVNANQIAVYEPVGQQATTSSNNNKNKGFVNGLSPNKVAKKSQQQQSSSSTFNNCQSNVAFLDNTNGISRVMNLKPKKSSVMSNKASPNLSKIKAKGISSHQFMNNVKLKNKSFNVNKKINDINNDQSSSRKDQLANNQLNKSFIQFNNFAQSPPATSTNNSYLTLKITGNGLQSKCTLKKKIFAF